MRIEISGRHMEITDALRSHVENGLKKIRTHFDKVIDVSVVLAVEKHRHLAEVTLHANGIRIPGKEASEDMYASLDAVMNKIEKQVRKYKGRINRYQPRKAADIREFQHDIIAYEPLQEGEEAPTAQAHRVIEREKLAMKPMSVEEAVMQLELAGDKFIVFLNADTQQVNVVYGRDDATFGLIEPQF